MCGLRGLVRFLMEWLPKGIRFVIRATCPRPPSHPLSPSLRSFLPRIRLAGVLCHAGSPSFLAHSHLPALTRPPLNPASSLRASVLHTLRPPTLVWVSVEDSLHRRRLRAVAPVEDSLHHSQPSRPHFGLRAGAPLVLVPRPRFAPFPPSTGRGRPDLFN